MDADPDLSRNFAACITRLMEDDIPAMRSARVAQAGHYPEAFSLSNQTGGVRAGHRRRSSASMPTCTKSITIPVLISASPKEEVRTEDILTFKQDLQACLSDVHGDTEDILY